jgi:hypothetical protein
MLFRIKTYQLCLITLEVFLKLILDPLILQETHSNLHKGLKAMGTEIASILIVSIHH